MASSMRARPRCSSTRSRSIRCSRGSAPAAARTLIELSNDAIRFAGNAVGRAPAIAKGLPARIHRLAAYGMAAEVAAADQELHAGELGVPRGAADRAAHQRRSRRGRSSATPRGGPARRLPRRSLPADPGPDPGRLRGVRAARARARRWRTTSTASRCATSSRRSRISRSAEGRARRASCIARSAGRARPTRRCSASCRASRSRCPIRSIATGWSSTRSSPRSPATVPSWRVIPFIGVMQAAFQITDTDMELAVVDALTFPAAMPRPG